MNEAAVLLKLLNLALTVANNMGISFEKISVVLTKAQSEGRDVTDEELKSIAGETDKVVAEAKATLAGL